MSLSGLIWLHEYVLAPPMEEIDRLGLHGCRLVHIWDDAYLQKKEYSLKRLAFIYQSLLETPADIIAGPTFDTLSIQPECNIYIPESADPFINNVAAQLADTGKSITWLVATPFAKLRQDKPIARFFQYWKKIERTAFIHNGGKQ